MTDKLYTVSDHWFRNFLKNFEDLRLVKTSAMDIKRVSQATPETRDQMFQKISALCSKIKETVPAMTWTGAADWPAVLKYW